MTMSDGPTDTPAASGEPHPAGWYADPMGRHEHRYWDGEQWTDHVSSHGRQSQDPVAGAPKTVTTGYQADRIQQQVGKHESDAARRGAPAAPPSAAEPGTGLLDRLVVVVNQKTKLIEINTEFALFDRDGVQVGAVRQVGQSKFKKALRLFGDIDQYLTHKFQVVDADGVVQLAITRPAKFFKSRIIIEDGAANEIGQVVQQNVFGKIRFAFEVNGQNVGGIQAENWRAWNFSITDASGSEVARVTKTFEGLLRTAFTSADNYVMQMHRPLDEPLRSMVFASAVSIDVALKQDARGLGAGSILDLGT